MLSGFELYTFCFPDIKMQRGTNIDISNLLCLVHMTEQNSDRIGNILKNGSVKRHFFHPSGREVWTVVGKDSEYWADPDLEFCCCKYFYYVAITRGTLCYHLRSILRAKTEGKYVSTGFDDSEYNDFLSALIGDILSSLLAV